LSLKLSNCGDFLLNFKMLPLFCCKTCTLFVLSIMRMHSRSLVSPAITIGLTSAVVFAIAIILLPSNITVINAQQQQSPTISQPPPVQVTQNGATTLFQSISDGIRLNVPEGWVIHDVNNTGSMRSEETRQGYGILAQLCPEELQQQQEQQQAAPSNVSRSRDTIHCQGIGGDIIHIVRYPDLDVRLQGVSSNITVDNNMTIDNILLYHTQKLEEVGYSRIQIINSTDTTLNVTNALTNQTIATVPAKFVEVTYSTASAPNVIREGYFMLAATDETRPDIGMTKGYSIFYEGTSTTAAGAAATPATIQQTTTSTPPVSLPPRQLLPIAVQQIFDSFELIVAPEVAQDIPAAQSVQAQEVREEPTNPLTVDITSSDIERGDNTALATFEFEADITGGIEPYTIRWDFDDDRSSEERSEDNDDVVVDYTFEEAGSYDVVLTITDSGGQSASDSIEINVEEGAPLAEEPPATEEVEEEQPITTEQPLTVDITSSDIERGDNTALATFEFEANVAGGIEPYTYSWDFDDDGRSSDEQTISHTFEEAGTYDVGLTITDSAGQRTSDSMEITVEEEEASSSITIIEPLAQGEDAISEDNLPTQQVQPDSAPPTALIEEIPDEQLTAQLNNQGGEQGETTIPAPNLTQSIQQNASQNMQVGIPNSNQVGEATTEPYTSSLDSDDGRSSSEERSDDVDNADENIDHIFDDAGSQNGGRTVKDSEDQRVSDSIESNVEAPPGEEPSIQEIPDEQLTAREVKHDLFDVDNSNSGSDDLIDVEEIFDADEFIDGLFDKLGLNN
jgi:PKD repeat protein